MTARPGLRGISHSPVALGVTVVTFVPVQFVAIVSKKIVSKKTGHTELLWSILGCIKKAKMKTLVQVKRKADPDRWVQGRPITGYVLAAGGLNESAVSHSISPGLHAGGPSHSNIL